MIPRLLLPTTAPPGLISTRLPPAQAEHAERLERATRELHAAAEARSDGDRAARNALADEVAELRRKIAAADDARHDALAAVRAEHATELRRAGERHALELAQLREQLDAVRRAHRDDIDRLNREHRDTVAELEARFAREMRGMLPADLRDDLESTISALRSQTTSLEARSTVLQERLDLSRR